MERRLTDMAPTRRDLFKWGGLALASTCIDRLVWPLKVRAAGKATPRGTARNCILIEMGGAISPMDTWDFKETKWTVKDLEVQKSPSGVMLAKTLFPQLFDEMHRVGIVRSMRAPELIHFNGQYHTQSGRALNAAVAKEIPAFGSIIAYELDSRRRESDTFPTYVSTSLATGFAGSVGPGFLPPRFSSLDLNANTVMQTFSSSNSNGVTSLLEQRWRMLSALSEAKLQSGMRMSEKATAFRAFYDDGHRILTDPRWASVFKATEEEKKKYGEDEYGLGLILAKNLLAADAGTHFVYVYDGNKWDHHSAIFDHRQALNHYVTCNRFDKGMASLLRDLSSMPGSEPGKTLLDETLIVATSEFGRAPFMNAVQGRDHYRFAYSSIFAGGGVRGGRVVGKTDETGARCVDTGWKHTEQPQMDNIVATIYSALGIDWTKAVENTPSGRAYEYVERAPIGGSEFISNDEIAELFV